MRHLRAKPAILIVDELAHSNLGESRHPKRYQDVEELLASGIDVWTALNIQHLESCRISFRRSQACRSARSCRIVCFKQADVVILIDLPPEELLARLREGKVYVPANAARATESFFVWAI